MNEQQTEHNQNTIETQSKQHSKVLQLLFKKLHKTTQFMVYINTGMEQPEQHFFPCSHCLKGQTPMNCPCCNSEKFKNSTVTGVYECKDCKAVFGQCYKGDSYGIVLPYMTDDAEAAKRQRYYDLTVLGSDGVQRRHGWFDPQTKRITQVG